MYFIAILIALGIVAFSTSWQRLQNDSLYYLWQSKAISISENKIIVFMVSVLLPCLLLVILLALLNASSNFPLELLSFLITIIVLLYSLGRGEYNDSAKAYCTAWQSGEHMQLSKIVEVIDEDYQPQLNESVQCTHVAARESFIYLAFTRFFVVLFWFIVLGPVAALCYRLTVLFNATQDIDVAKNMRVILEWPAGRVMSVSFALMGDFATGMTSLATTLLNLGMTTKQVVHANSLAALNLNMSWLDGKFAESYTLDEQTVMAVEEIKALKDLLTRCLVFAVIVMALFQIFV